MLSSLTVDKRSLTTMIAKRIVGVSVDLVCPSVVCDGWVSFSDPLIPATIYHASEGYEYTFTIKDGPYYTTVTMSECACVCI